MMRSPLSLVLALSWLNYIPASSAFSSRIPLRQTQLPLNLQPNRIRLHGELTDNSNSESGSCPLSETALSSSSYEAGGESSSRNTSTEKTASKIDVPTPVSTPVQITADASSDSKTDGRESEKEITIEDQTSNDSEGDNAQEIANEKQSSDVGNGIAVDSKNEATNDFNVMVSDAVSDDSKGNIEQSAATDSSVIKGDANSDCNKEDGEMENLNEITTSTSSDDIKNQDSITGDVSSENQKSDSEDEIVADQNMESWAIVKPPIIEEPAVSSTEEPEAEDVKTKVASDLTAFNSTRKPIQDDSTKEFFDAVLDVTVSGSLALLRGVRWAAANALTASLPEQEREDLLNRLDPDRPKVQSSDGEEQVQEAQVIEDEEEIRGSVQEEIALAVREEVRSKETEWSKEKEFITKQIEDAANARLATEMAIQEQRLEEKRLQSEASSRESSKKLQTNIVSLKEKLQEAQAAVIAKEQEAEARISKLEKEAEAVIQEKERQIQVIMAEHRQELMLSKQQKKPATTTQEAEQRMLEERRQRAQAAAKALHEEKTRLQEVEALLEKRKSQQVQLNAVENDLRQRAREIQRTKEAMQKMVPTKEVASVQVQRSRVVVKNEKEEEQAAEEAEDEKIHPILGPAVADLGYKRIHFVSSGQLGTIKIWKRQRTYRNSRAKSMANDKEKSMHLGFPGIICLHEDQEGRLSILDGQHRVGMMQALRQKQNMATDNETNTSKIKENEYADLFDNIMVEVYPQPANFKDADEHAQQVFLEINKAEPVKLLDMPGVASSADRKIITEAVSILQSQYPKMFSPSQRCRTPNVNVDNMRNNIYGANILKRHNITTSKKLLDWLLVQNAMLGNNYENEAERRAFISAKAWEKASSCGFYLGLESSWLYV